MSNKRAGSPSSSLPPAKRSSLSSWLAIPPPKAPSIVVSSLPVTDRGSTFITHAAPCTSPPSALAFQSYVRALRDATHPSDADHEMMGWRTMSVKLGRTGLGGEDDWSVKYGSDDDGEKNGGNTLRKCLEEAGAVDVVVVCSRYYGGVMLGPDRFTHMRTVTLQALSLLAAAQLRVQLRTLDAEIDDLIIHPALFSPSSKLPPAPDYDRMKSDVLERLVRAREKRRDFLRGEVDKKSQEENSRVPEDDDEEVVVVNQEMGAESRGRVTGAGDGSAGGVEAAEETEDVVT